MKLIDIKIPKKFEFQLFLRKEDNEWCWEYNSKTDWQESSSEIPKGWWRCSAKTTRSVNPIPRIKNRLLWLSEYWYMVFTNTLYQQCQGCGEGIAKYKLRDPNHGSKKWLNCCEHCYNFYWWKPELYDIVGWKNKKPVCKKPKW